MLRTDSQDKEKLAGSNTIHPILHYPMARLVKTQIARWSKIHFRACRGGVSSQLKQASLCLSGMCDKHTSDEANQVARTRQTHILHYVKLKTQNTTGQKVRIKTAHISNWRSTKFQVSMFYLATKLKRNILANSPGE